MAGALGWVLLTALWAGDHAKLQVKTQDPGLQCTLEEEMGEENSHDELQLKAKLLGQSLIVAPSSTPPGEGVQGLVLWEEEEVWKLLGQHVVMEQSSREQRKEIKAAKPGAGSHGESLHGTLGGPRTVTDPPASDKVFSVLLVYSGRTNRSHI